MLDPERAVLIKCSDARFGRHELRAALDRCRLDELKNGLFGRAVIPRRQWVLSAGDRSRKPERNRRKTNQWHFEIWLHRFDDGDITQPYLISFRRNSVLFTAGSEAFILVQNAGSGVGPKNSRNILSLPIARASSRAVQYA